ncbi:MAG: hypothetical protein SFW36_19095 [Leptolyngbyaceae cyanobacterium bins.59]|nr:hypothetical protein [Leptolyngbyaceae cyanobacterium bins.59]
MMTRFLIAGFSALMLAGTIATSAQAQSSVTSQQSADIAIPQVVSNLDPFEVATLAYQGAFEDQGIPSAGQLLLQHHLGSVTSRDIVQSAIDQNLVPPERMNDVGFRRAIDYQLSAMKPYQ